MVNVREYNKTERRKLEEIASCMSSLDNFTSLTKQEKTIRELNKLNPMWAKDRDVEYNRGIYDRKSGYERKLPLDKLDSKIIRLAEHYLRDWEFVQVRIQKDLEPLYFSFEKKANEPIKGPNFDYVVIFKKKGKVERKKLESKLDKSDKHGSYNYSPEFLKQLGFDLLQEDLNLALSEKYKVTGISACPDVDWGHQGEAPFYPNFDYMMVCIELQDKQIQKGELRKKVISNRTSLKRAKQELNEYK